MTSSSSSSNSKLEVVSISTSFTRLLVQGAFPPNHMETRIKDNVSNPPIPAILENRISCGRRDILWNDAHTSQEAEGDSLSHDISPANVPIRLGS